MNNFQLVNADTDSISICKPDGAAFSEEEMSNLVKEINSQLPEKIKFEPDGYFRKIIVLKTKNYVLDDGKKIKTKGSALRDPKREPALREFLQKVIELLLNDRQYELSSLYKGYVREIDVISDIKRWAVRKTITDKVTNAQRTNEQKIKDIIENTEYVEGDRIYVFFKPDESLELVENFNGEYNKERLYRKLFQTAKTFDTILETDRLFPNLALKRNQMLLNEILTKPDLVGTYE